MENCKPQIWYDIEHFNPKSGEWEWTPGDRFHSLPEAKEAVHSLVKKYGRVRFREIEVYIKGEENGTQEELLGEFQA